MIVADVEAAAAQGLTVAGAVLMVVSIGLVLTLVTWCVRRILQEPDPAGHHHAPLEIERDDEE